MASVAYPARAVKGRWSRWPPSGAGRPRRAPAGPPAQLSGPLNVAPWIPTETWSPGWMDG